MFRLNYTVNHRQVYQTAALKLTACKQVLIINTAFEGSDDSTYTSVLAIVIHYSEVQIKSCSFENNTGGSVSVPNANLIVVGCFFNRNKGTGSGGIIDAQSSS